MSPRRAGLPPGRLRAAARHPPGVSGGDRDPGTGPADVLFDLDGTLVDSWALYLEAYRRALEPMVERMPTPEEVQAVGPSAERHLFRGLLGEERGEEAHRRFRRHYEALHDELFEGVYPGVLESLDALRRRGRRLGIVTGKSRPAWEVTRRRVELGPFHAVVTEDEVAEPKPSPQGLELALEELDVPPDRTVYVGDALTDLEAARAAGIRFAAALWGKGEQERPDFARRCREAGAWRLVERPERLVGLVGAGGEESGG